MVPSLGFQMGFHKRGPWHRPKRMILPGITNPKIIRVEGGPFMGEGALNIFMLCWESWGRGGGAGTDA